MYDLEQRTRAGVADMAEELDRSVRRLPEGPDEIAPDGAEVRLLAATDRASTAHFKLQTGQVTRAVRHRHIDEIWYITSGDGEVWLQDSASETNRQVALQPGQSIAVPQGVSFQCRNTGRIPLEIIAVQVPPWPGDEEAMIVAGPYDGEHR